MKQKLRTVLTIACILSLSACGPKGQGSDSQNSGSSSNPTPSATVTESTAAKPKLDLNPLTGLYDVNPGEAVRPVCIMIGNNDRSRPQSGLDKADMYVEGETEGGITRIMAVFSGTSRVPEKLGPVRSARTPFVMLVQSLDAIYCHAGGSNTGMDAIKKNDIADVDALGGGGAAYWRDPALRDSKGLEYSMMTSGEKLAARVEALKYRSDTKKPSPFTFGNAPSGSGAGEKVQISLSGNQTVSFTYDANSHLYSKINGSLSNGEAHKTLEGVQLTATNVLVMYDEKYNENNITIGFRLSSGNGLLVTGGNSRPIRWKRTADSLSFTEENGNALNVNQGKTYICLTNTGNASKTIVQ